MSLRSRLSQLQTQRGSETRPVIENHPVRTRLARIRNERIQGKPVNNAQQLTDIQLAEHLDGQLIAQGLIKIVETFPLTGEYGNVPLVDVKPNPKLPNTRHSSTTRQLYIDTETTGLSGGSGTLAFLIGIAEFYPDSIQLTQFLMTRFSAESALLSAFNAMLDESVCFVSYNGKSYDLPLLSSRFLLKGLKQDLTRFEHIDLLHPTRRLFSNKWPNCRLITVENKLLDFYREDDLPGSEAPEAWFSYVRNHNASNLIRVVAHNKWDIISLAVIHGQLTEIIEQGSHPDLDLGGLARWLEKDNETRAKNLLQQNHQYLRTSEKLLLARYYRRAEQWHEAVEIWQSLASTGCTESLERLAKYYEHVDKDLQRALDYCEKLGNISSTEYRKQRLHKKLRLVTPEYR